MSGDIWLLQLGGACCWHLGTNPWQRIINMSGVQRLGTLVLNCKWIVHFEEIAYFPLHHQFLEWRSEDTDYDFLPTLPCSFQKLMGHGITGFVCSPHGLDDVRAIGGSTVALRPSWDHRSLPPQPPGLKQEHWPKDSGKGRASGRQSTCFLLGSCWVLSAEKQEQQLWKHTDLKAERFVFFNLYLAVPGLSCSTRDLPNFLQSVGSLVVACRISFPDQGSNLCPLHWEHGVLATGTPGKSWELCYLGNLLRTAAQETAC